MMNVLMIIVVMSLALVGCVEEPSSPDTTENDPTYVDGKADNFGFSTDEIAGVIRVANELSFEVLDDEVPLDRRAALGLVERRPFQSIDAVDAVPYVGPSALSRMRSYAYDLGWVGTATQDDCALISEYVEGPGRTNKAIEIFNCGTSDIDLGTIGVCLVRNDDTNCSKTDTLPAGTLMAGDVITVCRALTGTFNDPMQQLINQCDVESKTIDFNGDDRLILFSDNGDGTYDDADTILDLFGDKDVRPPAPYWSEVVLRRTLVEPLVIHNGRWDDRDWFEAFGRTNYTHLGIAP